MHEYTVALRVAGEKLDLDAVTVALGFQPTHVIRLGEIQQGGPATKAMWSLEVFPAGGGEWNSLEQGLTSLLTAFSKRHSAVRQLQHEHDVYLWCGHFSSSFDGGPSFSARLLAELAQFGVPLYLDTYHSEADSRRIDRDRGP